VNADAGSGTVTGADGNPEIIEVALGEIVCQASLFLRPISVPA
jgi:hypothetical protein